ncbi:MAG: hypothetical protein BJ554DRAFT_8243 [Olpidium bornovanus]|uniref:Uncharacterized protein n=1 Tax=Olpidium bornovanus TaxID=278681 RepID=A0A8H8DIT4_9FUNG|nr:MAG: hypothetical protein BJ554DRAFT_8243 [Olpidium bornovanus]
MLSSESSSQRSLELLSMTIDALFGVPAPVGWPASPVRGGENSLAGGPSIVSDVASNFFSEGGGAGNNQADNAQPVRLHDSSDHVPAAATSQFVSGQAVERKRAWDGRSRREVHADQGKEMHEEVMTSELLFVVSLPLILPVSSALALLKHQWHTKVAGRGAMRAADVPSKVPGVGEVVGAVPASATADAGPGTEVAAAAAHAADAAEAPSSADVLTAADLTAAGLAAAGLAAMDLAAAVLVPASATAGAEPGTEVAAEAVDVAGVKILAAADLEAADLAAAAAAAGFCT